MDNFRRFLFTFTCIVFLSLCVGGFVTALNYDPSAAIDHAGQAPITLPPVGSLYDPQNYTKEELFSGNVLYVITPDEGENAVNFIVAKHNLDTQELFFLLVPDELKVVDHDSNSSVTTLGEYYADNGAESAAKYLSALFAIDIPCYASIDYDTMNTLISNFGSLPVDLPMAISYLDTDSEQTDYASDIDYEKGDLALTGKAAVNLLKFANDPGIYFNKDLTDYYNGKSAQAIRSRFSDDLAHIMLQGFVKSNFVPENEDKMQSNLEPLLELSDGNISENILQGITYELGQISAEKAEYYLITGDVVVNDAYTITYSNTMINMSTGKTIDSREILDYKF